MLKNGELTSPPQVTITDKSGKPIESAVSISTDGKGNQMVRIHSENPNLLGKYRLKLKATDNHTGASNDEAEFNLTIAEPVLKLTKLHSAFESGSKTSYTPGSEPIYIPLPEYKSTSS